MKTRALRDRAVTELGFGGASLGNLYQETSEAEARLAVDAAWDGGVRYYDTAPHYGLGLSERRLGAALAARPRDEYVLSTKVGRLLEPNPAPTGSDMRTGGFAVPDDLLRRFDFGRDGVLRSLEASLDRLGLSRVDVVYVHDPDEHLDQAIAEAVPVLAELRGQGVIGAVGAGLNQWQALLRMVRESDLDVVMLAGRWTLLDRSGAPLLAECAERGIAVAAAAPYNSGLLARDRPAPSAHFDYGHVPAGVLARARALADACQRHGAHLPAAALQFPLRHPAVVSVVAGMRTADEVDAALRLLAEPLPEPAWAELDAIATG
ncbi:MAG TPA: aldo/keto reductase [Trebonia sp.]|nr:aldo/keto reductase [Trebonia sp.]